MTRSGRSTTEYVTLESFGRIDVAAVADAIVACHGCNAAVTLDRLNIPVFTPCVNCQKMSSTMVFPALVDKPDEGKKAEHLGNLDEASCFYHDENRAASICEKCGRFLCNLCSIELGGTLICPACTSVSNETTEDETIVSSRRLYADVALYMAFLPLLMWPVAPIMGLVTLVYAIRARHKPPPLTSTIRRTRGKLILASVVGLLEALGGVAILLAIMSGA